MKATFSVLAALVLVSQAHAQQYVDQYGNAVQMASQKKAVQYDEATNTVVEVTPTNTQSVHVQQTPIVLQQAPVYQVMRPQEQPVTVVEGKHLRESKADSLRKARTDMETDTEQKIVEKLEEARMRDEAARADKLFGGASASAEASATAIVVAVPAPAPVMAQPVAPPTVEVVGASAAASSAAVASGTSSAAAAAAEAKLEIRSDSQSAPHHEPVDVKSEIRAALDEREYSKKKEKQQLYVGALAGMSEYPDVVNMRGNGSTGFAVGVVTKNRVIVEGSFQYSNFDIEDLSYSGGGAFPVFKNLDQYNTSAAVKFQILPGSLRPFIGGLVSYTHRTYSDRNSGMYNGPEAECSTQAVDVGVTAGADMSISDNFAIGADFKYMTNVTSRQDSRYQQSIVNPGTQFGSAVEDLQYYTISLAGKFLF